MPSNCARKNLQFSNLESSQFSINEVVSSKPSKNLFIKHIHIQKMYKCIKNEGLFKGCEVSTN